MKKDEIIELLKEQIAGLRADNDRLLLQVEALLYERKEDESCIL